MNILIITNILTPYRMNFFKKLDIALKKINCSLYVATMVAEKSDRKWKYEDLKEDFTILLKDYTVQFKGIYLHYNKDIEKEIIKINPKLIICAGSYLQPTVQKVLGLKKKYNYKVLFWSESHLSEQREYSKFLIIIREFIRKSTYIKFDGFWYSGQLSKQFIEAYKNNNQTMHFLPNTIDNHEFHYGMINHEKEVLRNNYNIREEQFVFFIPARLIKVKGIEKFLMLFSKCQYKDRAIILIAGEGNLKQSISKIIEEKKINVKLLGHKNQDEIIKLYSLSDCFVLPSISDANPLTVIEALWSGLPLLLSTNVGNYPEAVEIGENGYVFSYDDSAMAINIIDNLIISDDEWRESAKVKSLEIAQKIYDSDLVIDDLVKSMVNTSLKDDSYEK